MSPDEYYIMKANLLFRLFIQPVIKTLFGNSVFSSIQLDPPELISLQKVIDGRAADSKYLLQFLYGITSFFCHDKFLFSNDIGEEIFISSLNVTRGIFFTWTKNNFSLLFLTNKTDRFNHYLRLKRSH